MWVNRSLIVRLIKGEYHTLFSYLIDDGEKYCQIYCELFEMISRKTEPNMFERNNK